MALEFGERERYDLITRVFDGGAVSRCIELPGLDRVYALRDLTLWAILDRDDYEHFSRWRWSYTRSPTGKLYVARTTGQSNRVSTLGDGEKMRWRTPSRKLYLHREIMLRTGVEPPTPAHKIVGHWDGNSLNCMRYNLEWTTISGNNVKLTDAERARRELAIHERSRAGHELPF